MSTTVTFTDEQAARLLTLVNDECEAAHARITSLFAGKGSTATLVLLQDERAAVESIREAIWAAGKPAEPRHTVNGKTSDEGWGYGTTHDMDCPACLASGSSFLTSPRSETYWSS